MATSPYFGKAGVDDVTGTYDLMVGEDGDDALISTLDKLNVNVVSIGGNGDDFLDISDTVASELVAFGEAGEDILDGGQHNDVLYGGTGDDRLTGWLDTDYLYGGEGNDKIYGFYHSSQPGEEGDARDYLYGGAGNDQLFGNAGGDILRGGAGKDKLTGGAGVDEFWFDTKPNGKTNVDRIMDFNPADDIFVLAHATFNGLPLGGLPPGLFQTAKKALEADDRLIYDQASGRLSFDPDGKGGAPQVLLATLENNATLTNLDFFVVLV